MSNSDRVVLALGGAGTVGSGIVKALLDKGKLARGHLGSQRKPLCFAERTFRGNILNVLFEAEEDIIFSVLISKLTWMLFKQFYAQVSVSRVLCRVNSITINCRADILLCVFYICFSTP